MHDSAGTAWHSYNSACHTPSTASAHVSSSTSPSKEGVCVDISHDLHVSTVHDSHRCGVSLEFTRGPVHGVGVPGQPALQITQTHHTIVTHALSSLQSPRHTVCHSMLTGQYHARGIEKILISGEFPRKDTLLNTPVSSKHHGQVTCRFRSS